MSSITLQSYNEGASRIQGEPFKPQKLILPAHCLSPSGEIVVPPSAEIVAEKKDKTTLIESYSKDFEELYQGKNTTGSVVLAFSAIVSIGVIICGILHLSRIL